MARPSHHIDQRLLDAGLQLLPSTGCRHLSARRLAEHAGVNLGMFHYHFRSKDNFIRTLLERVYEQMFAMLVLRAGEAETPLQNLHNALDVLARFGAQNHSLLLRIAIDAINGESIAADFLRTNIPRHIGILATLIADAQRDRQVIDAPLPRILAFLGGALIAPVLLGPAIIEHAGLPHGSRNELDAMLLSEEAITQRIEFTLRGLAAPKEKSE